MASDLSSYKVATGETPISSAKFNNLVQKVQDSLNGLGGALTTWATGKVVALSQLTQSGAATGQSIVWNGTDWVAGGVTYALALPGSPADGQEVVITDSLTVGSYAWRFRYNASAVSAYKWDFIGGAPLAATVNTTENKAVGAYGALATAGPTVTVPLAGDYDITVVCEISTNAGSDAYMSYDVGGTGALDLDGARVQNSGSVIVDVTQKRRKTGLSAATAITAKYKTSTASADFLKRRIEVVPVRVG